MQILSAASDKGKIEITAKHIDSVENIVTAKDNVVVYYEDSVIKASSATFDKSKKLLVLDGNIEMIGYKGTKEHSNHIEIYTDTKEVAFDELDPVPAISFFASLIAVVARPGLKPGASAKFVTPYLIKAATVVIFLVFKYSVVFGPIPLTLLTGIVILNSP